MPQLIKHIDKIAREKNRTVLFVSFEPSDSESLLESQAPNHHYSDFQDDVYRLELLTWLDANGIGWEQCSHIASENGWQAYSGNIYVDVPWDATDPLFAKFRFKLETPDGTPRNPLVKIWACDLEQAMKNAHHDEPGFWEKWAETF
jgi:hypothetical protein